RPYAVCQNRPVPIRGILLNHVSLHISTGGYCMKTNVQQPSLWRWLSRTVLTASGVVAVLAVVGGYQPASAQALDSFKVVTDITPFRFSLKGTNIPAGGNPNLNGSLNTQSPNVLEVGWDPPSKGSFIDLVYTGSNGASFGTTTLNTGDH